MPADPDRERLRDFRSEVAGGRPRVDIEDGDRPTAAKGESAQWREINERNLLLDRGEVGRDALSGRSDVSHAGPQPRQRRSARRGSRHAGWMPGLSM